MEHLTAGENLNQSYLDQIPPINIEFEDLSYFVGNAKTGRKQILKSINGKFFSGQLSGILGSSCAGKSSLLNVLAGYVFDGVQGNVKINGQPRQMEIFYRLSTFIMQESLIQPYLTVEEDMMMAAHFKLGNGVSVEKKQSTVTEILNLLGLDDCNSTRVEKLSGGQKKRLSIALELLGNPPIIFLDEPTSGLDSVSIRQCIDVLKTLTNKGRTVICTINQPSVSILAQFDQAYFLANGICVYNGTVPNIPLFLSSLELQCPLTYSYSEFVIELVESNQAFATLLANATNNGKNYVEETAKNLYENDAVLSEQTDRLVVNSIWSQLNVLLHRTMLQESRNKLAFWIRLLSHTVIGLFLGALFYGIGNDANEVMTNFKMCTCVEIFLVYCYLIAPVMLLPFELKILKQEYFNRWYGLTAYYIATTLRNVPFVIFMVTEFSLIIYLLTKQPLDVVRFFEFSLAAIIASLIAEGIGLAIGAVLNSKYGSIVAPAVLVPWTIVVTHGFGYMDQVAPVMEFLKGTSFIHYIFVAMNIALYKNRDPLYCPEEVIFCYYKNPDRYLKDLGATDTTFGLEILISVGFLVFFRTIAYLLLCLRLNPEKLRIFSQWFSKVSC